MRLKVSRPFTEGKKRARLRNSRRSKKKKEKVDPTTRARQSARPSPRALKPSTLLSAHSPFSLSRVRPFSAFSFRLDSRRYFCYCAPLCLLTFSSPVSSEREKRGLAKTLLEEKPKKTTEKETYLVPPRQAQFLVETFCLALRHSLEPSLGRVEEKGKKRKKAPLSRARCLRRRLVEEGS